jgi:uncharacterized delta-60 repeat protein
MNASTLRGDRSYSARGLLVTLLLTGSLDLVAQPGTLDTNFAPVITGPFVVNVQAMTVQTNDQVVFGGTFTNVSGFLRKSLALLNANGTVDGSFNPGNGIKGGLGTLNAIAVQPADGKILIGGDFTSVNGASRQRLARLNPDGSVDQSFNPGAGANAMVSALAVQPDGRILVAGAFTTLNGISRGGIARVDTTGALDTNFVNGAGADSQILALALQPDGEIIIGGRFLHFNGVSQNRIARIDGASGALDPSFNIGTGASAAVNALVTQPDGKILVGGGFTSFNSVNLFGLVRLQTNGTLDTNFITRLDYVAYGSVFSVALQSNGKVYIGGNFSSVGGVRRPSFARLNTDGTLDTAFVPDPPNSAVAAIGLQSTGDIIVAGGMAVTDAHGNTQFGVARLHGDVGSSPPTPPLLSNPQPVSGGFQFTINGEVGRSYVILDTVDLVSWQLLTTQMQATVSQTFTDSSATGVHHQFYRVEVAH